MILFIKELLKKNILLIKYAIIGGISATLDFTVFSILSNKFHIDYLLANIISVHCGIICSFILNRQYNFKIKNKTLIRFSAFYVIGLLGLAVSTSLLFVLVDISNLNKIGSKFSTIIVVALLQFILNKTITFKTKNTQ